MTQALPRCHVSGLTANRSDRLLQVVNHHSWFVFTYVMLLNACSCDDHKQACRRDRASRGSSTARHTDGKRTASRGKRTARTARAEFVKHMSGARTSVS